VFVPLGPSALPVTYRHNRVVLLQEGRGFFHSLHAALRSAERFILIEYYLIRNDRTGAALAAELAEAVRRGVRVLLITTTSAPSRPRGPRVVYNIH